MSAPVSACLIVRDDESTLEECLRSVRPHVDEIVVVDTGSVDSSPDVARRYADRLEVYTGCNDELGRIASFSDARNRSFALASNDRVLWVDADDVVRGAAGIRALSDRHLVRGPSSVSLPYEYSHDPAGNPSCVLYRERLVYPRAAFSWTGDVHEVLSCGPGCSRATDDSVTWVHRRSASTKPREAGRNLRILEAALRRGGDPDPRVLYYLGREYGDNGMRSAAVRSLEQYVSVSTWDDEKYTACVLIAGHHMAAPDYGSAISWLLRAAAVMPDWPEAYLELAKCHYYMAQGGDDPMRNWDRCVHFARFGMSLPHPRTDLFVNPLNRDFEIHRFLNVALGKLGLVRDARDSVRAALRVRPDQQLADNERLYDRQLAVEEVTALVTEMAWKGYVTFEAAEKALAAVSGPAAPRPSVPGPGGLRVSVYVGPGLEPWNPRSWGATGLGGSETAVVELFRRLAAAGHSVTVYGHCPAGYEGVFDGVAYLDGGRFGPHDCDVLVTSRRPQAVDEGVRARATVCWVHDVDCGPWLTPDRAARIDRFMCLSEWHRGHFTSRYPHVGPDRVVVTRNGIDLGRFSASPERDPHRAVYSSSPDRGLEDLLDAWPEVRSRVPDASLGVYYGFDNWEAVADAAAGARIAALRRRLADLSDAGVSYHGRVNQARLADAFLRAGVWAYPTRFSETSCITAMEAQAAGLAIVTSPVAALNETVGPRGTMVEAGLGYAGRFAAAVADAMTGTSGTHRAGLRAHAAGHFGWDGVADEWDLMFRSLVRGSVRG